MSEASMKINRLISFEWIIAISLTLLSHSAGILIMVMTKQTTTNKGVFKRNGSWTIRGVSPEMDVSSLFYFSQKTHRLCNS